MKLLLFITLLLFQTFSQNLIAAHLRLPSIINDNMVLQQQSDVPIWGWAEKGKQVSVKASWLTGTINTKADDTGKWKIQLETLKAGGPYELKIKADTTIVLKNVMIGEVWICSGQSNMSMPLKGFRNQCVNGGLDYIAEGNNKNIRLFRVKPQYTFEPQDNCIGNWSVSNPTDVANFSATAYTFGKYLQDILGVPIGLIMTSLGATPVEAWTDNETLKRDFKEVDVSVRTENKIHKLPGVLFNGMIKPIIPFGIKGAIWYQGESNRNEPELYSRLFPAMIKAWRQHWGQGDFPFYFVQIAPFDYKDDINSAFLREAQLMTMQTTPNTGMAVTIDIGDSVCVHPPEKITIGKRLAYWALANDYGLDGIEYSGPIYKSMKVEKNKVIVDFDFMTNGLSTFGKSLESFIIAGADSVFHAAKAAINRNGLMVWSDSVKSPIAVRYCWENDLQGGNLYNTIGLPASPFRTDNWRK